MSEQRRDVCESPICERPVGDAGSMYVYQRRDRLGSATNTYWSFCSVECLREWLDLSALRHDHHHRATGGES
jgi:hypothetical protein